MAKKGRKSAYEERIKPNFAAITEMCKTMTDKQIAKKIGVSYSAFNKYKATKKEFAEILKKGRENLVVELRSVLINRAKGFHFTETKITIDADGKIKTENTERYALPDVAALNLLLKNYDKENWANDPQELELKKRELALKEERLRKNMEDDW